MIILKKFPSRKNLKLPKSLIRKLFQNMHIVWQLPHFNYIYIIINIIIIFYLPMSESCICIKLNESVSRIVIFASCSYSYKIISCNITFKNIFRKLICQVNRFKIKMTVLLMLQNGNELRKKLEYIFDSKCS